MTGEITGRQRILSALAGKRLDRPPIWFMRQAGRYLPEYRNLKERHSFLEMVKTPELACEVTMQPLQRFPLDAAIVFSDILVIPEALGQPYHFRSQGGIQMDYKLEGRNDFSRLSIDGLANRLSYVGDALKLCRKKLGNEKALLGFAGAPWTLACYMLEGGSSDSFAEVKKWFYTDREAFDLLMELLSDAIIQYLNLQVDSGVDAVQIFDSWAAASPAEDYEAMSLKWIRKIVSGINKRCPVILYAKGVPAQIPVIATSGVQCISCDWTVRLCDIAKTLGPKVSLQGNLDPVLLHGPTQTVVLMATRLLESMRNHPGYIFNLGHGIMPQARIESVDAMIHTVTSWQA